jgi:hypothetical protein
MRGVVRNVASREAGDGTGLGTKAVLGDCAGSVDEGLRHGRFAPGWDVLLRDSRPRNGRFARGWDGRWR